MTRREFFSLTRKVGLTSAALLVPWDLLQRVGATEDWYAEAATLPQNYLLNDGSAIVDTSSGTSVITTQAVNSGDATWAVTEVTDEVYLWPKYPAKPTKALKVQCTAAGSISSSYAITFTVAVTPNATHNLALFMMGENLGGGTQSGTVRLGETSAFAKYYEWNCPFSTSAGYESKWFPRVLPMAAPTGTSGAPDATVSHVRIRVILGASTGTTPTYYIGSIRKDTLAQSQIAIVFDDANTTDYTAAFPYMQARGLVGSCAIDQSGTNMTIAQMLEMQAAGWSMHNHTATHADLSVLTASQIRTELETCRSFLRANGLDSGPSVFVLPFGSRNATVDATVLEYYPYTFFSAGETVGTPIWPGFPTPSQMDRVSMDAPTTSSTIIGYINSAVSRGNSIVIYGHNVTPSAIVGNTDVTTFQPIIDHIYRMVQTGRAQNRNLEQYVGGRTTPRLKRIS